MVAMAGFPEEGLKECQLRTEGDHSRCKILVLNRGRGHMGTGRNKESLRGRHPGIPS